MKHHDTLKGLLEHFAYAHQKEMFNSVRVLSPIEIVDQFLESNQLKEKEPVREECEKCNSKNSETKFLHKDKEIYWSEHKEIQNLDRFTQNDRYYYSDRIDKECLLITCKNCGFKKAVNPTNKKK